MPVIPTLDDRVRDIATKLDLAPEHWHLVRRMMLKPLPPRYPLVASEVALWERAGGPPCRP